MIHVICHQGLGDNFAARPTIAALLRTDHVAIETAWPEVFADLSGGGVTTFKAFVVPQTHIRCAERNARETKFEFLPPPVGAKVINLRYVLEPGCKSIPEQIARSACVDGVTHDEVRWEDFFVGGGVAREFGQQNRGPLGCFRIPTIRTEYRNVARNPAPGLVAAAVQEIAGDWIHLNDVDEYKEKFAESDAIGTRDFAAYATNGQLSLPSMLDLVARARCVVTPISWMAWAAMAYQGPTLCVWGGYCQPKTIFGPYSTDLRQKNFDIVTPMPVCECFNPSHDCSKSIPVERVREAARCLR